MVGCNGGQPHSNATVPPPPPSEQPNSNTPAPPPPPTASGVSPLSLSPFRIINPGGGVDFKSYAINQLTQAHSNGVHDGVNEPWAFEANEVASLDEFYFVDVEIKGFELMSISIAGHGVFFYYWDMESISAGGVRSLENRVSVNVRREVHGFSRDEHWQGLTEQLMRHHGGILTEDGMLYTAALNDIVARIDDTIFSIRVPSRLNDYEFLRDLALEVIETAELVVIEPPPVLPEGVLQISAGTNHSLKLRSDGTVWAWGANNYGQLGIGEISPVSSMTQVIGLTDVIHVAAGETHSLAVKSDGTV